MQRPQTFCFDLDGTLCTNTWGEYEQARPFPWAIERVNALARAGHRILIFTARGGTTGIDWRERTEAQLQAWGVHYDELVFGKPTADVYVDDRTVHVDAWRYGSALTVPLLPGHTDTVTAASMPVLPPPRNTTVVEVGRTFGGEPFRVKDHAQRVLAVAQGQAVPCLQTPSQIAEAVSRAIEPSRDLLAPGDDLVFTIGLSGLPHAAYLDTLEPGLDPGVTIGCRLLSQAARGLAPYMKDGGIAAQTLAADAATQAWPLASDPTGGLSDLLGGEPLVIDGQTLRARPTGERPNIALAQTLELARQLGLDVKETPVTPREARQADEVLIADFPFCVLPVSALDQARLRRPAPGPVAVSLLEAWSELAGLDVHAQWQTAAGS